MAKRFKPRRQARFDELVHKYHFLTAEAVELSKIKKMHPPGGGRVQYPPALRAMKRSRLSMWANFRQWVGKEAWLELTAEEISREWSRRIRRFYEQYRVRRRREKSTGLTAERLTTWVVRRDIHGKRIRPTPSVWDYYDWVFGSLPEEDAWDSPRSHRRRTANPDVNLGIIQRQRFLAGLRETAKREPQRREELELQAKRLGGKL